MTWGVVKLIKTLIIVAIADISKNLLNPYEYNSKVLKFELLFLLKVSLPILLNSEAPIYSNII